MSKHGTGDAPQALALLDRRSAQAVIADKAYDADAILAVAADWHLYRQRHKIESLFGCMKHYRRVFVRFDRLARRYPVFVHLVAACILLRQNVNGT